MDARTSVLVSLLKNDSEQPKDGGKRAKKALTFGPSLGLAGVPWRLVLASASQPHQDLLDPGLDTLQGADLDVPARE